MSFLNYAKRNVVILPNSREINIGVVRIVTSLPNFSGRPCQNVGRYRGHVELGSVRRRKKSLPRNELQTDTFHQPQPQFCPCTNNRLHPGSFYYDMLRFTKITYKKLTAVAHDAYTGFYTPRLKLISATANLSTSISSSKSIPDWNFSNH